MARRLSRCAPTCRKSTLLEEVGPRRVRRVDRVPLRRFDGLFGPIARPASCKIDVQGADLMVLAGMTGRLTEVDALVIETSTIATMKNGAEVGSVRFLGEHASSWPTSSVCGGALLDNATAQLDLLFVPKEAALRTDRRWAASSWGVGCCCRQYAAFVAHQGAILCNHYMI